MNMEDQERQEWKVDERAERKCRFSPNVAIVVALCLAIVLIVSCCVKF